MRSGLTLFEILAVLVIIGMLAGVLAMGLRGALAESKQQVASIQVQRVADQVERYRTLKNELPNGADGLASLSNPNASSQDAYYIETKQLNDPWGHPLQLVVPGKDNHPYEVISYGADGVPGGTGDNADVSSLD